MARTAGISAGIAIGRALEELISHTSGHHIRHAFSSMQNAGANEVISCPIAFSWNGQVSPTVIFTITRFHDSLGKTIGYSALSLNGKCDETKHFLPPPVSGVFAWCGLFPAVGSGTHAFKVNTALPNGVQTMPTDKGFETLIENVVKNEVSKVSKQDGPVAFSSKTMSYETTHGTTGYVLTRGMLSKCSGTPLNISTIVAEGYAIDVTDYHKEQQGHAKWCETWRSLSQLAFDFILLVDVTEEKIIDAWGETSHIGQRPSGRLLCEYVSRDNRAATRNAVGSALAAPYGIVQVLVLRNSLSGKPVKVKCTMLSDNEDPSQLIVGASLVVKEFLRGGAGDVSVASAEYANDLSEARAQRPSTGTQEVCSIDGRSQDNSDAGGGCIQNHGDYGVRLRLTSTALSLVAAPCNPHILDSKVPIKAGLGPAAARIPIPSGSKIQIPLPAVVPTPKKQGSEKSPSTRWSQKVHTKPSRLSTTSSLSSDQVPRVYPTQVILHDDANVELWRSSDLLLGENRKVADFCTPASQILLRMPEPLAKHLRIDTHELFVVESSSGELLQVTSGGTKLGNLLQYGIAGGKLTFVIAPVADSDDAFEILPP